MARKTTGNTSTTTRRKKAEAPLPQMAPELQNEVKKEVHTEARAETRAEVRTKAKKAKPVSVSVATVSIEEQIRRRAYELYLQRTANGGGHGSEHQDWLTAEREVLSRHRGEKGVSIAASAGNP